MIRSYLVQILPSSMCVIKILRCFVLCFMLIRDINMKVDNKFLKIELREISLQALDMQIAISNCYDK